MQLNAAVTGLVDRELTIITGERSRIVRKGGLSIVFMLTILLVPLMNCVAVADVITPMHPQHINNLKDVSDLMLRISEKLSTGKMPADAQRAAASITQKVAQMLQDLSDAKRDYDNYKKDIDQMKESWQPFSEGASSGN
jgi:hypothetical protein